ncbi:MAG: hypothetical protein IKQ77_00290 [Prevotella sp.]|nr:hypothetical protein [Prevotella sp.]
MLGNNVLAQNQNQTTYSMKTQVKETIDFTGWRIEDHTNWNTDASITWNGNIVSSVSGTGTNGNPLTRSYTDYPVWVGTSQEESSITLYSGRVVFDTWASSLNFTIGSNQFANAKVGDIIRVYYTDKVVEEGENKYNPFFKYVNTWQDFNALQDVKEEGDGYFQAVINDQSTIDELKARGLRFQGRGFTLTSVVLIPAKNWILWTSRDHDETYLQKNAAVNDYLNIGNLKAGDVVTIWGDNGNQNGGCTVTSNNTTRNNQRFTFNSTNSSEGQSLTMQSDGTLQLLLDGQYSGIRKIEITREPDQITIFDYDPGYEEYDMYDEFSWAKDQNNPATTYHIVDPAGFQLNGKAANYVEFDNSKITTNKRIALTGAANEWQFDFGLVPPGNNGNYSYLSICNLKEGDRVVISYINDDSEDPLIFASGYQDGAFYYNGCAAFKDDSRDGVLDDGEQFVYNGYAAPTDWHRNEPNVARTDQGQNASYFPELNYINSYVITEDGHLDLAFKRFVQNGGSGQNADKRVSRIVKIKIFSDHQATMVDDYTATYYKSFFDITGELQAKEHIMPGGLEIQVGNNDASQHAIVVSSKEGPVSYVNAVDGFKIPGVSKNGNQVSINFDLGINGDVSKLPQSGTFYKFIPEVNGKMSFTFEAKSMNYYRWDLKGFGAYYNTDLRDNNGNYGNWSALNDRPNEQTVPAACPYYLVTVENGRITNVRSLGDIRNGGDGGVNDLNVQVGKEYYLFGAWNQSNLYYNSSWTVPGNPDYNSDSGNKQYNNIEFRPFDGRTVGCGIAQLLEVYFTPDKRIYPLAKWVPNGTQAVNDQNSVPDPDFPTDASKRQIELADLYGYNNKTSLTVKKMAGNITGCRPYLQQVQGNHYKLMIDGITFADNKDKGGTILIKIGDARQKVSPVYTLTIAYSGDPTFDGNSGTNTRGHIWDYSTKSLNGLKYEPELEQEEGHGPNGSPAVYTPNAAQPEDYGHYFADYFGADVSSYTSAEDVFNNLAKSSDGKLHDEITSGTSEWMFNYNLVNDGKLYDPVFTNKYDLEADNADLIWETEGTVIKASANASVMFNEYIGDVGSSTDKDPDRYVGVTKATEFRIPWLMPNDRVIIWMGTGKGAFNDHAVFNIRNAYDALHNEIDPLDDYIVGGSQWNEDEKEYKGCYHFFAKGDGVGGPADMVFKMKTGSMCKIYKIQIYRGNRIITNEIVGETEDDNKFLLWSRAADPNDNNSEAYTDENRYNWTLKYFGKNEQLANGTGKKNQDNEIIAKTGKYSSETPVLTDNYTKVTEVNAETGEEEETATTEVKSFTYTHQLGEIGTFRMRGKDMEKNMNYVADYADHNVTIAYQETMTYPYTWDFTDVIGNAGAANVDNLFKPEEDLGETIASTTKPDGLTDAQWETLWNGLDAKSYQKTSRDLSLWEVTSIEGGEYMLRLNSQSQVKDLMEQDNIFETAKEIGGNQVWANGQIVPEMEGILLYTDNNNQNNGEFTITTNGLDFTGAGSLFKKIVVPNVPATENKKAAVYLRMTRLTDDPADAKIKYKWGEVTKNEDLAEIPTSDSKTAIIYQVPGTEKEYIVALANPNNSKTSLTFALNGYRLHKMAVSVDPKKLNKYGWATESRERYIDPELTAYLTGEPITTFIATEASVSDKNVLLKAVYPYTDKGYVMDLATEDKQPQACILYNTKNVNPEILNGGFHLFVPDMHDYDIYDRLAEGQTELKMLQDMSGSKMLSKLNAGPLTMYDGDYTNYVLTFMTNKAGWSETDVNWSDTDTDRGAMGFYRVQPKGVTSSGHQGYMQFLTSDANPNYNASNGFTFIFEGDDITSIGSTIVGTGNANPDYYNLWGQKLNGQPTQPGIYIVNGKKVTVK